METKKTRILNTKDFNGDYIYVFKSDFEIYKYISGYYGICLKDKSRAYNDSLGKNCVFGGDSAWEDCYNKELITDIFKNWDGKLHYSNVYGYVIEL